jgi:hypothetical protein
MARKQQGKSDDELSKELEKLDAKVNSFCLINFSQLIIRCAGGGAFTTLGFPPLLCWGKVGTLLRWLFG